MFSDPGKVIEQLYVAEGMTVADFGAGIGFYALQLARRVGPYGRVFAIDVDPDHLRKIKNEAVKEGMNQLEVIQGDLESFKGSGLVSASVDRIVIANVLFQSENPKAVVKEAKRILKHSGKIAVVEWVDSFNQIGPHPDHILTQEDARTIFESNGFVLESFIDAGSHHYGLLYVHEPTLVPGEARNMHPEKSKEEINPAMNIAPEELRNIS
ncbi:MAG: class I SAM-dependent methyltransferase [Candidatus Taylorbacteria bacterium]|nr:class I SAM-dependent methyltransferase [Candidatus Taylorbacteria bacterium]